MPTRRAIPRGQNRRKNLNEWMGNRSAILPTLRFSQ
jgi:hypothetical protein